MKNRVVHFVIGILAGALIVLTVQNVAGYRRMMRTRYEDWRKLNLVLQTVD